MKGPASYSEWVNLLEEFGNGGDAALATLSEGSFIVDAGTASRFNARVEEAYKKRKEIWLDKFQLSFKTQKLKSEEDFEIALRNGKQNLYPLIKFIVIKGFPENLQKVLKKDLEDFVGEIKKSLTANVSRVAKGREKMLIILNTFGAIDEFEKMETDARNKPENLKKISPPSGRKIIF